jgi:hypothetical protein
VGDIGGNTILSFTINRVWKVKGNPLIEWQAVQYNFNKCNKLI